MTQNYLKERFGAFKYYLFLLLLVTASATLGYYFAGFEKQQYDVQLQKYQQSVENLTIENDRLTRDLNILGVDLEVSRLASEENREHIKNRILQENDLRKELSFYQKVMAPELEQDGFIIDSFNVEPTASDNYFRYALVLMQQDKLRTTIKGQVTVTLMGSLNGQPTQLDLDAIQSENSDSQAFSFRYFEVIRGEFNIPATFQPELIIVESRLKDKKWGKNYLKRSFDWQLEEPEPISEVNGE